MFKAFFSQTIAGLFLLSLANLSVAGDALPTYYQSHAEGWFWYHDHLIYKTHHDKTKLNALTIQSQIAKIKTIHDPIVRVKAIQHLMLEAKDRMVLKPTLANVQTFIALQQQITNRATTLRKSWQEVLLNQPQLDYSLKHPTSNWAKQLYNRSENKRESALIENFSKTHGLFFFYRGSCPHCRHFAPVLKDFATRYHLNIIPVSLDGGILPEFPHSRFNQGQAERLHVSVVPALFAINPRSHEVISLGAGDRAEDELKNNLITAITYQANKRSPSL